MTAKGINTADPGSRSSDSPHSECSIFLVHWAPQKSIVALFAACLCDRSSHRLNIIMKLIFRYGTGKADLEIDPRIVFHIFLQIIHPNFTPQWTAN